VVVDVLSFTTAVTVSVGRGIAVYPHPWPSSGVADFAAVHEAERAVPRHEVDSDHPWSLSPADLLSAPTTERLVLPSPNGSTIAAAASSMAVVAGCLRNATAVGRWLSMNGYGEPGRPVAIVAGGERWPDGSLRPALEDLLGAAAIIAAIEPQVSRSPEAVASEGAWRAHISDLGDAIRSCASGRELIEKGYAADIEVAAVHDAQVTVPVLTDGAFHDASTLA
jgi:2-phosphosulfolactate phosphatase